VQSVEQQVFNKFDEITNTLTQQKKQVIEKLEKMLIVEEGVIKEINEKSRSFNKI